MQQESNTRLPDYTDGILLLLKMRMTQLLHSVILTCLHALHKVHIFITADPSKLVLSMLNRTDEAEFICQANGTGSIKPKLEWIVNGVTADREVLRTWTVRIKLRYLLVQGWLLKTSFKLVFCSN